jgi:protein SCO1
MNARYIRGMLLILILTSILVLGGCGSPYEFRGTLYDPAAPAAEITGTNWDGNAFQLSDLRGRVALLFFGYTFCPDVCPTTLSEMRRLHKELGDQADDAAVVFVSVDPERDTPDRLAQYVPLFGERFYGIHVDQATLEQIKSDYGVIAEKRNYDKAETSAGYLIDHTARVYLVDQDGNLKLSFAFGTPVEDLHADVAFLLK